MKLQFLVNSIKRDLGLLSSEFGHDGQKRVSLEDVQTIFNRWEKALKDEESLQANEQRFQDLLTQEEHLNELEVAEAFDLLVFIHKPLIAGYNDVMGVRLKDADYLRLTNKIQGKPIESGVVEFEQKIKFIEKEERRKKAEIKAKKQAEKQAKIESMQ